MISLFKSLDGFISFDFMFLLFLGIVKHIQSICKAVITDILPNEKHTEAFGKSAAISSIGFILGPLLGGQISEVANGFSYVCFFTMVLFFVNIGKTILSIHISCNIKW